MTYDREEKLRPPTPLRDVPVLPGHRPVGELPSRSEVYGEIFAEREAVATIARQGSASPQPG